jgi:hypothetical protein
MRKYFRLSVVLAVVGALVLGALGSGLWELLFKPLLTWITTLFLNIATLGINSLRDDLYAEIAKGIYDRAGLLGLALLVAGVTAFFLSIATLFPLTIWMLVGGRIRKRNLVKAGAAVKSGMSIPPSRQFRTLRWSMVALISASLFEASVTFISFTRENFISTGAVYLDQSQRIIAPFLTDDQRVVLRSRAASMQTRADFDNLNSDIVNVAQTNKVSLPKFVPF